MACPSTIIRAAIRESQDAGLHAPVIRASVSPIHRSTSGGAARRAASDGRCIRISPYAPQPSSAPLTVPLAHPSKDVVSIAASAAFVHLGIEAVLL